MGKKIYNKLIRHRIPDINTQNGKYSVVRVLNDEEFDQELFKKLVEEAWEVNQSKDEPEKLVYEIADLSEVMDEILRFRGISKAQVRAAQAEKRKTWGSFNERIFLVSVMEKN